MIAELDKTSSSNGDTIVLYTFKHFNARNRTCHNFSSSEQVVSLNAKKQAIRESRNSTNTLNTRREKIRDLISDAYHNDYKEADWNGYQAKALDSQSVEFAKQFLESLSSEISLPIIDPNPNGLLGLYWSKGDHQLLLDITPSGTLSYAFRSKGGLSYTGRPSFFSAIPKRLNALLIDFFKD